MTDQRLVYANEYFNDFKHVHGYDIINYHAYLRNEDGLNMKYEHVFFLFNNEYENVLGRVFWLKT